MKRHVQYLFTVSFALLCAAGAFPQAATVQPHAVLAQDLGNVRASGKVMAALWTARDNSYTLQLILPLTTTAPAAPAQATRISAAAPPRPQPAKVQVWLLEPDGTLALPTWQSPAPKPDALVCLRCTSYEFSYSFALAAGSAAVAVAVRINDDFYIDQLHPL